jgi:hypothetical protein
MKYSRAMVEKYFIQFAHTVGKDTNYWVPGVKRKINVGAWVLDFNATYGGYIIHEVDNAQGGERNAFNNQRMKAEPFMLAMDAVMTLIYRKTLRVK